MYQFSDSESKDSDEGIRFKTDSIRNKNGNESKQKNRSRSKSPRSSSSRRRDEKRRSRHRREHKRHSSDTSSEDDRSDRRKRKRDSSGSKNTKNIPVLGPQLPPNFKPKVDDASEISDDLDDFLKSENQESSKSIAGPALPPHLQQQKIEPDRKQETDNNYIGPALPPHLQKKEIEDQICIGPTLPPHLREKLASQNLTTEDVSEDEDFYGPVPEGENFSKAHLALEERALQMKLNQLNNSNEEEQPGREEWMLELPAAKQASFGLGPRQFRSKTGPDMSDRSSWTDTPEDKAKKRAGKTEVKVDLQKEAELKEIQRRDIEQETIAKKHRKKNKESLLEIHTKKLKKSKKEDGPSERRPFNRDTDLQVNRFDEAQKKAVLKKAQLLDDRFSRGQSKFL